MTQPVVVDASAGVELVLASSIGQQLRGRLPAGYEEWVPEVYFAEVAATLRRLELAGTISPARPPWRLTASSLPRPGGSR